MIRYSGDELINIEEFKPLLHDLIEEHYNIGLENQEILSLKFDIINCKLIIQQLHVVDTLTGNEAHLHINTAFGCTYNLYIKATDTCIVKDRYFIIKNLKGVI